MGETKLFTSTAPIFFFVHCYCFYCLSYFCHKTSTVDRYSSL